MFYLTKDITRMIYPPPPKMVLHVPYASSAIGRNLYQPLIFKAIEPANIRSVRSHRQM